MNPRRTLQENESALRKVLTQRTLEALSKQNVAFVLEHQNDTLEQLSAYLSACMDTLGHVPAWTEVLGGDLIDLRFGGWAQALHSIGQTGYDDAQEPPRVQDTQLFRNEYDRQRVLDKQKKLEKKALSRERTKQDKAARKAKKQRDPIDRLKNRSTIRSFCGRCATRFKCRTRILVQLNKGIG